jgi:methylglutamate dehydrogenase subunit D
VKLQARSAFANIRVNATPGRGVIATDRDGLAAARVAARQGRIAGLTERVRERFGIALPSGPARTEANGLAFIGIGVETWLSTQECNPEDLVGSLRNALDDVATVSEQSGGYSMLRLTGPRIRETFAKFVAIDLHAREFQPGAAASTVASHIPLTLWRLPDGAEGHPVFEVVVQRSLAESFCHVLTESAAEFGLVFAP